MLFRKKVNGSVGILATVLFAVVGSVSAEQTKTVTFQSLLGEMVDIGALAEYPEPAYVGKQSASYDLRSTDPNIGTDENWFANNDWEFKGAETVNGESQKLLMDVKEPGAIGRIWSATPGGTLRIYIDGAAEPTLEFDWAGKFAETKGTKLETLIGIRGKGSNIFLPIPFAKSCKVTSTGGQYYQINYRSYAEDVAVESFRAEMLETFETEIEEVAVKLAAPEKLHAPLNAPTIGKFSQPIEPGESWKFVVKGEKAISGFACMLEAEDIREALRSSLLRIWFDGQKQPAVECPLGDFYGSAPGVNPYKSLPFGVYPNGMMYCHYLMPFQKEARFEIVNQTDQSVKVSGQVVSGEYEWNDRSMYFHANWQTLIDVSTRPRQDWNWLTAEGQGVYVGAMLNIMNPVIWWWGEGDEKVYIDGEEFPSIFGTGTEDYFSYAWCWFDEFEHAYHNQTHCDRPGNIGHSSVNRFHFLDAWPFTESIRFDMEIWHHMDVEVSVAQTTYWYAKLGATHQFAAIKPGEMIVKPAPTPTSVPGVAEGEGMKIVSMAGGATTDDFSGEILEELPTFAALKTSWGGTGWSGYKSLFWYGAKDGDVLELGFEVPKAGKYKVIYCGMKGAINSNVKMGINGIESSTDTPFYFVRGEGFDISVAHAKDIELGEFDLKAGQNVLAVKILPSDGLKPNLFVIDYLRLAPVE